ncbi:MAG: hypothetical protein N3E37_01415 [Candidatus Micrarchaeota archaeon]|nr:hypothetical protein [Candidatus Micrarchaeota archaeon]
MFFKKHYLIILFIIDYGIIIGIVVRYNTDEKICAEVQKNNHYQNIIHRIKQDFFSDSEQQQ